MIAVVDRTTLGSAEHPVLAIDMWHDPRREMRIIASEFDGLEANLSLANMDFFEFAEAADADGVFRRFPAG